MAQNCGSKIAVDDDSHCRESGPMRHLGDATTSLHFDQGGSDGDNGVGTKLGGTEDSEGDSEGEGYTLQLPSNADDLGSVGRSVLGTYDVDSESDDEVVNEVGDQEVTCEFEEIDDEEGYVLEIPSDADDLSSMGRSVPAIYDGDHESEEAEIIQKNVKLEGTKRFFEDSDDDSEVTDSSTADHQSETKKSTEKQNPKLGQFFDRLCHLLHVRVKIDDRVSFMDPLSKLSNLKVKVHSDGIQKKNGKFKKEFQQRSLNGKVVRNLDDLIGPAKLAQEVLTRLLSLLAREIKDMQQGSYVVAPLKQRNRAFNKAQEEYSHRSPGPPESWLYDVVRASIYCKSYAQIAEVNKWISRNTHIVRSKNRFDEPCFNGYRDLIFHVSIPFKDDLAHICEIQVHHKEIKALDEQLGIPRHYEYFRSVFAGHRRSEALILEDLAMLNRCGGMGGECMEKLLQSTDPDQLHLFARLCSDNLEEFDHALDLYNRILQLQLSMGSDSTDDIVDTHIGLGTVLGAMGRLDESLLNLEKALDMKVSLHGTERLEVAEIYSMIGHIRRPKGEYNRAFNRHREALNIRESILGNEHVLVVRSLQDIGNALRDIGEFRESEDALRRALGIQETLLGASDLDVAATRSLIGVTLYEFGDHSRAMEEHRHALTIYEAKVGKNHKLTADCHVHIGDVLCRRGEFEVAEWRYRKALRIHKGLSGKDAEAYAICLTHLGGVLMQKGDDDGAINALKRARSIHEDHRGMDHPSSSGSHLDLAKVYLHVRQYDKGLEESRRAKAVRESFLGSSHPDTAEACNYVGKALSLKGQHELAVEEHRQALSIYEAKLGENHPKTATGHHFLADTLHAMGEKDNALNEHRRALAVRASVLNKDHPDTALSCSRIGTLLREKCDLVGSLVAYRQALAITVVVCGEDHPETASAQIQVAKVVAACGDVKEAIEGVEQALKVRRSTLGHSHPETGRTYGVLGTLHRMIGHPTKAKDFHRRSVLILERELGTKNPSTEAAQNRLEAVDGPDDDDIFGVY